MTKIIASNDCGNSPKNLFVQTLAVSIEAGDGPTFARYVIEAVTWAYPGRPGVVGSTSAIELLRSMRRVAPVEIRVRHAISHGRTGAASGTVRLASGKCLRFCHVIEFASVKGDRAAGVTTFYADSGAESGTA